MKKLLLTLGTIAAVATPVAAALSCGTNADPIKPKASAGAGATVDASLIGGSIVPWSTMSSPVELDPKTGLSLHGQIPATLIEKGTVVELPTPYNYAAQVIVGGTSGVTTTRQ